MPFYTVNIPLVGQNINVTQQPINDNFTELFNYLGIDHVALNAANSGNHNAIHFEQVADPTTTATEVSLYNKLDSLSINRLFLREPSSGTIQQLTGNVISPTLTPFAFETMLLGGIIIKGALTGVISSAGAGTTVTYASLGLSNFPNRTLNIQMTAANVTGNSAVVSAFTASQFTAKASSSSGTFYMVAIGN